MIILMTTSLGWGGTEGHVTDLAIGLVARGVFPIVVVDSPPLNRMNILNCLGVKVEVVTDNQNITKTEYSKSLNSILTRLNPSLIHLNIWERQSSILRVIKKIEIPVVITRHTTVMSKLRLKTRIRRFFSIRETRKTYRDVLPTVINISELSLKNSQKVYPFIKNTTCIYCGAYFPKERNDVKANGTAVKVLWIGSLIERKRPILALEIWGRIAIDFPKAQLIMVGDGPEMGRIKTLVRNMPPKSVLLCGNIPDLHPILKKSHIMFHTSTAEGIPKNIRYALNFGIPVVTTNVGAISEAIVDGENGFLVGTTDIELMEVRLRELISGPALREKMGTQGRQRGNKLFRLDSMVDNVLGVYRNLCGENPTAKESNIAHNLSFPLT